jgi:hypothetical protein
MQRDADAPAAARPADAPITIPVSSHIAQPKNEKRPAPMWATRGESKNASPEVIRRVARFMTAAACPGLEAPKLPRRPCERPLGVTASSRIQSAMPDGKPITDPETIAAYVRIARIVYGIDDDRPDPREIDHPPIVVETLEGAKVRAWDLQHPGQCDESFPVKATTPAEIARLLKIHRATVSRIVAQARAGV